MAQRSARQVSGYNRYVSGSAAYDYDYLERERRRRAEQERRAESERRERQRRAEQERREYAERRARAAAEQRSAPRRKTAAAPRARERQRVSFLALLGFAAAAALLVMLLMDYARLTMISTKVVSMQNELATLQDEHVALVTQYEKTFDLTAVKEAAEAAGMAKPSASQICYVDLSAPDSVVIYTREETNFLGHVFTSLGQNVVSVVEYFK